MEEIKMEPTSVWKIENIDKIWITQDGDEISFLVKNKDDLTKIILTGDAIKNHNDNFITTLKVNLDENEKEFRELEKENKQNKEIADTWSTAYYDLSKKFDKLKDKKDQKIKELEKKISELEKLKTPTIENFADEKGHSDQPKADNVNHPSHYETGKFECIEVMQEVFGINAVCDFCKCNAFKYIYRMDRKNGDEDVRKAIWYLNKYLELSEKIDIYKEIGGLIPRPEFVKDGGTDNGRKKQIPEGE